MTLPGAFEFIDVGKGEVGEIDAHERAGTGSFGRRAENVAAR